MAYLNAYETGSNYISVQVKGLDTSYSRADRSIVWKINNVYYYTQEDIEAYLSETIPIDFTGLNSNTGYSFTAEVNYTSGGVWYVSYLGPTTFYTTLARPSNFSWTYTKVSGNTFIVTANEWNAFTTRINEFRAYKSLSNFSFTTAYTGNNITADIFNEVRLSISSIPGSGSVPNIAYTGNIIYASDLNALVSALNAVT